MQSQAGFDQEKVSESYTLLMHSLKVILEDKNKGKTYQSDQAEYYQSLFADIALFQRFTDYLSVLMQTTLNLEPLLKAIHHAKILCDKNQEEFSEINDVNQFIHHFIRDPVWDFHYVLRFPEIKKLSLGSEESKVLKDLPLEVWKKTMSFFSYRHQLLPMELSCKTFKGFTEDGSLNHIPYSKLDYGRLIDSLVKRYSIYDDPYDGDTNCFVMLSEHEFLMNKENQLVRCDVRKSTNGRFGMQPEYPTMEGHQDSLTSICVIPDEQKVATGSKDKTIRIWDMVENKCIKVLKGHGEKVNKIIMYYEEIISASDDKTMRIWDWKTGKSRILATTSSPIIDMVMINDHMLACSTRTDVMIADLEKKSFRFNHLHRMDARIQSICFSANRTLLVSTESCNQHGEEGNERDVWLHEVVEYFIKENMKLTQINLVSVRHNDYLPSNFYRFAYRMYSLPDGVIAFVGDCDVSLYSLNEQKFMCKRILGRGNLNSYVSSLPDNRIVTLAMNSFSIFPFAHKNFENKVLEEKSEYKCTIS